MRLSESKEVKGNSLRILDMSSCDIDNFWASDLSVGRDLNLVVRTPGAALKDDRIMGITNLPRLRLDLRLRLFGPV